MQIHDQNLIDVPTPLSVGAQAEERRNIKLLGISPAIVDGIRGFRVIWRPALSKPVHYRKKDGSAGAKRKSDTVRTLWFPIVGEVSERQAFQEANRAAALAYGVRPSKVQPRVEWGRLARLSGQKVRSSYAKPALNGAVDRAAALFVQGYSPRQVAEKLRVDRSTASRWRKRLGLEAKKSPQS